MVAEAEIEIARDRPSESALAERYHIILRIRHPDLDPAEITAALRWVPHHSWKRGDPVTTPKGNKLSRLRLDGLWSRTFRYRTRGKISEHLEQILDHMMTRKDLFQELDRRGARTALYLQLPGDINNGDDIKWETLKKFVDLRIAFEIETFPDWA